MGWGAGRRTGYADSAAREVAWRAPLLRGAAVLGALECRLRSCAAIFGRQVSLRVARRRTSGASGGGLVDESLRCIGGAVRLGQLFCMAGLRLRLMVAWGNTSAVEGWCFPLPASFLAVPASQAVSSRRSCPMNHCGSDCGPVSWALSTAMPRG